MKMSVCLYCSKPFQQGRRNARRNKNLNIKASYRNNKFCSLECRMKAKEAT